MNVTLIISLLHLNAVLIEFTTDPYDNIKGYWIALLVLEREVRIVSVNRLI